MQGQTTRRGGRGPGGGGGSELEVLERRGEDVDLRWWRGGRCLGERERRWSGLGVEDGYGRRGEREEEVDMGRRWREWWWRGLGVVDGYGRRGERGARWGLWGEGEVDVGRRWRAWQRWGERERWWRGLWVGVQYGRRGERESLRGFWGEGEVDIGRQWRLEERKRRERGPGGWRWRLGERERREWVVEACWRCGERERQGWVRRAGGGAGAMPFAGPGLVGRVGTVRRCWRVLRGLAQRRLVLGGLVGVRWRQWVVIRVGWGPGGPLCVDVVAGGIRWLVWGGWPLVVGGVCGWSARWLPSHTLAVCAPGVVAPWGRVVASGSCGGGVGGGGAGAAGGCGVGSGGVGAAGAALGPLVGIPVSFVGVGGRAPCAAPGAVLFGG